MQGQSDELLGRILEPWIRETSDAVGPDPGVSRFLERCRRAARAEILNGEDRDPEFRRLLGDTLGRAARPGPVPPDLFWPLLFPEGARLQADPEAAVRALREKRRIRVLRAEPDPIVDPIREILFTSNILLTIPSSPASLEKLDLDEGWKDRIRAAGSERQSFSTTTPSTSGNRRKATRSCTGFGDWTGRSNGRRPLEGPGRGTRPPSCFPCRSPTWGFGRPPEPIYDPS